MALGRIKGQSGLSLAETIVAGAVATIILMGIAKFIHTSFKASSKVSSTLDLDSLQIQIQPGADCSATFGTPSGAPCGAGTYVDIRNSKGGMLIPKTGLQVGKFFVRARCESNGISVRGAELTPAGLKHPPAQDWKKANSTSDTEKTKYFARDEMEGTVKDNPTRRLFYDWSHPKGDLIPAGPGGLCGHLWGTAPDTKCTGPREYIKSVNLYHRDVECGKVPTCTGRSVLVYDANAREFRCSSDVNAALQALERRATNLEAKDKDLQKQITNLDKSIGPKIQKQIRKFFDSDRFVTVTASGGGSAK